MAHLLSTFWHWAEKGYKLVLVTDWYRGGSYPFHEVAFHLYSPTPFHEVAFMIVRMVTLFEHLPQPPSLFHGNHLSFGPLACKKLAKLMNNKGS
jgi:hypothetical protein